MTSIGFVAFDGHVLSLAFGLGVGGIFGSYLLVMNRNIKRRATNN